MKFQGTYTDDWEQIAQKVKDEAGWRCVRCKHPHATPGIPRWCDEECDPLYHESTVYTHRVMTVHHLNGDKSLNYWWNLAALCQSCHLHIQAKVDMERPYLMLPHSAWFKPYVAGWNAWYYMGVIIQRDHALREMAFLLELPKHVRPFREQVRIAHEHS